MWHVFHDFWEIRCNDRLKNAGKRKTLSRTFLDLREFFDLSRPLGVLKAGGRILFMNLVCSIAEIYEQINDTIMNTNPQCMTKTDIQKYN